MTLIDSVQTSVDSPFIVGKKYLLQTQQSLIIGQLKKVFPDFLLFTSVSLITGTFSDYIINQKKVTISPITTDLVISRTSVDIITQI